MKKGPIRSAPFSVSGRVSVSMSYGRIMTSSGPDGSSNLTPRS